MILLYALCHCMGRFVPAVHNHGKTAALSGQAVPSVYPVGSARLVICAGRCLAHGRAEPDTLASHCIHYAMSTRFSLPFMGRCKNFLQHHRVFFIFSAQCSTPSAGVERLPIPFLRKHQQNTPPSVLSATEMPKHLRPVPAL